MLVYLHGLNSSSRSAKSLVLRERLAPWPVLAPDYPAHRPREAVARLTEFFANLQPACPAVVGSSMGGFYGQWLARRFSFSHLFMINPAVTPWDLLAEHLGEPQTTAEGETYAIDAAMVADTRPYGIADPCDGIPTTVFLDRGDEVIDYRIAQAHYRRCGRLLIWDGGDHAFQHLDEAVDCIRLHLEGHHGDRGQLG